MRRVRETGSNSSHASKDTWLTKEAGMPDAVENIGSLMWDVPDQLPTGHYSMRIASSGNSTNHDEMETPFFLRGKVEYGVALVPGARGSFGTAAEGQVRFNMKFNWLPNPLVLLRFLELLSLSCFLSVRDVSALSCLAK